MKKKKFLPDGHFEFEKIIEKCQTHEGYKQANKAIKDRLSCLLWYSNSFYVSYVDDTSPQE